MNVFFVHQIKKTGGVFEKGIVVKDSGTATENQEAARQAYHAYMGAYAYGNNESTDYVSCEITDLSGNRIEAETWKRN